MRCRGVFHSDSSWRPAFLGWFTQLRRSIILLKARRRRRPGGRSRRRIFPDARRSTSAATSPCTLGSRWHNNIEDAVVQVLIEFLRGEEVAVADGTFGRAPTLRRIGRPGACSVAEQDLLAVGRGLLNIVYRSQVPLEDVRTVERLLKSRASARAERAHHSALVVCERMPVLVVLARKAFGVILAGRDGALLGSLLHVREHVCRQILEEAATFRVRALVPVKVLILFRLHVTSAEGCNTRLGH